MPTAFRVSWDRVCCGKILKYDGDECSQCGDVRDDLYGCEYCGDSFCEEHLMSDEGVDVSGYRGEVDSGHPIENHAEFTGGAYCGECASNMVNDGSLDDEGNPIPDDEEMPVPPNQEVAVPENPLAEMSDAELAQRVNALTGTGDPFLEELIMEATRRTVHGEPDERANISAQLEGVANERLRRLGQDPRLITPPVGNNLDYGFPEGFTDKFASADAFTSAWDVVKRERI